MERPEPITGWLELRTIEWNRVQGSRSSKVVPFSGLALSANLGQFVCRYIMDSIDFAHEKRNQSWLWPGTAAEAGKSKGFQAPRLSFLSARAKAKILSCFPIPRKQARESDLPPASSQRTIIYNKATRLTLISAAPAWRRFPPRRPESHRRRPAPCTTTYPCGDWSFSCGTRPGHRA